MNVGESLRVLYISGYTEDVMEDGGVIERGAALPAEAVLCPQILLAAMRKLLDKRR